jgi:excisionase family DNA binding protein
MTTYLNANERGSKAPRQPVVIPLHDRAAWSVREFCALHGISPATLYRRAADGSIRLLKSGGRTLITKEAAEAWKARMLADPKVGS